MYHAPSPKTVLHPRIITDPPPCFIVWWTYWGLIYAPSPIQHHNLPFELHLFIFVLSLKIVRFRSSMVQFSYFWANLRRARTCSQIINGFLCCTCAPSLKTRLTVMPNNNLLILDQSCFAIADVVPSRPSITRVVQHLISWYARSFGRPPLCLSMSRLQPSSYALQKIGSCPLKWQLCK